MITMWGVLEGVYAYEHGLAFPSQPLWKAYATGVNCVVCARFLLRIMRAETGETARGSRVGVSDETAIYWPCR